MRGKDKVKNKLIEILNIFSSSISLDQNDKDFSEYYQSWNMPLLKRSELAVIIENIKKSSKNTELRGLLSSYFTFEPEILQIFVEKYSTDIRGLNKCSYIVIANTLGYISNSLDIQYLDLVLNSLYFFFNHMTLSPKMQYLYFLIVDYITSKQNILIPQSPLSQIIEAISLNIESSKMVFNSACNLLESLYILNDCLNAEIILKVINNSIRKSLENNTYHENDVLIRTISFRLQYFESPVLDCVSLLGQTKVNDAKKGLFAMLGNYFYSLSHNYSSNIIYPIENDSKYAYFSENPKFDNIEFHHSVVTSSMFNVSIPGVNSSLSEEVLIDNKFLDKIEIIGKILQKSGSAFTSSFFMSISSFITDENCNLMVYSSYLYLLKRTTHTKNIPEKVFYTIMNKVIFNPFITMFDKNENFEHLAFLRQSAIETIFLKMPQYLPRSLVILRDFPYIFAEICLRIQILQLQGVTFEEDAFQALSAVEQKLRSIYSLDPDNAEKTIQARDSLFVFIFEILNNPQVTTTCFSSPSFASAFLTAFFEDSFSDIIFRKMTQVFRTVNSAISQTVSFVTGALRIFSLHTETEKTTKLASRFLACVFDGIQLNPVIVKDCDIILSTAIEYANNVPSYELLTQILQLSMQQFVFNPDFNFDIKAIRNFASLMKKCEGNRVSELTKNKLLSFLSASQTASISFMTLIQKPSILLLIFGIYTNSLLFEELFRLMMNLVNYSIYNCIKFHEGEIDCLLLDMIIKFPNNFSFRGVQIENFKSKDDIVKYVYPLLSRIITIKSSTVIAEKIMQILLPTKGIFHDLCDSFITFLLTTVQTLNNSPPIAYPLGISRLFATYSGIPCIDFFRESSIVFWMKVDTVLASQISTRTSIFNTFIDDIEILELYFIQNILFLDLHLSDRVSSFKIFEITNSEWNCATIVFRTSEYRGSLQFKLTTRLNCNQPVTSTVREPIDLPDLMRFEFGNSEEIGSDKTKNLCAYQVHNFTVYSQVIDSESSTQYVVNGYNSSFMDFPVIFSTKNTKNAKILISEEEIHDDNPNIIDIYKKYIPPETFVPVFSFIKSQNYVHQCVNFIFLFFGRKIINCIDLIPFYLKDSPSNILTVQLYNNFYNMLELFDCKEDIELLIEQILFNGDLWVRANSSVVHKIISQWTNVLNELMIQNKFYSEKIFSKIFLLYRRNFYISDIEKKIICNEERDNNLDLNMIHSLLGRLITDVCMSDEKIKITEKVTSEFLEHCIFCEDLVLAERMITAIPIFLSQKPSMKVVNMCHYINANLQKNFIFIFLQSLQIFYPNQLYQETILLGSHLPPTVLYDNIFCNEFELDLTKVFPLFFMIVVRSSIEKQNIALSKLEEVVSNKENIKEITSKQHWFVWFILLCTQIDPQFHLRAVDVFSILLSEEFDVETIEHSFILLDLMKLTTKLSIIKIKCLLAISICDKCEKTIQKRDNAYLIGLCFNCVFVRLRCNGLSEKLIDFGIKNSPFSENFSNFKIPNQMSNIFTFTQLKSCFSVNLQNVNYWLFMTDWDRMNGSQQFCLDCLLKLLEKTPLLTPLLHIIQLISRYPKANSHKKHLILQIISEKEKPTIDIFIHDKFKTLVRFRQITQNFFDFQDKKLFKINQRFPIIDPAKKYIEKLYDSDIKIRNKVRSNIRKFMNEDSIWEIQHKFVFVRDCKFLSNFDSIFIRKKLSSKKIIESFNVPEIPSNISFLVCKRLKITKIQIIKFYVDKKSLHLIFDNKKEVILTNNDIRAVFLRRTTGIEIFTNKGKSYYLDFSPVSNIEIISTIKEIKFSSNTIIQSEQGNSLVKELHLIEKWHHGQLSNYDFLLWINMISGRSYNDLDNYPIFPWVETYFKSPSIRNLSFPITMQSTKNRNINQQHEIDKLKHSPNNRCFVCSVFSRLEPFYSMNNRYNFPSFSSIHSIFERIRDFNENRESFSEIYSLPEIFICGDQTLLTPKIEIISATPIKTSTDDISEESSFSITIADDDLSDEKIECISSPHIFLRASESWTKVTMNDQDDKDKQNKVFSFVYQSRKLLNSLSMSPSLCRWIDFVFGVDQTNKLYENYLFSSEKVDEIHSEFGILPEKIFNEHLTFRNEIDTSEIDNIVFVDVSQTRSLLGDIFIENDNRVSLVFYDTDNYVFQCEIDLRQHQISKLHHIFEEKQIHLKKISSVFENKTLFVFDNKIIDSHNNILFSDQSDIDHFYFDNHSFIICNHMGVLTLVSSTSNNTYVFNAFSEYVTCVSVSTFFRISVVSLSDGKLLIFDNDKHRLHRLVSLGEYIFHIIISPSSGYILCKAQHEYFVVSINGSIIKRCPFDRMTNIFCTWTDNNFVDYVCSSDQQGNIVVFESFFPDKLLFAAACGSRTLCIKYDKYSLGLCVFTEKSQFLFYPFS